MSEAPALAPLREPNFRYYWLSRLIDRAGSTMAGIALAFAVLEVSDSATALGTVLAAYSIPMVVFLLAGGVLADRFGRTLVIQATNVASGLSQLAMAALVITGTAEMWHLVVLARRQRHGRPPPACPAMAGVLPQLVPREQLKQANLLLAVPRERADGDRPRDRRPAGRHHRRRAGRSPSTASPTCSPRCCSPLVRIPPPPPREERRRRRRPARGVDLLPQHDLAVGRGARLRGSQRDQQRRLHTLGPVLAIETDIGEGGWGLILSAQAVGFLVCSLALIRTRPAPTAAAGA